MPKEVFNDQFDGSEHQLLNDDGKTYRTERFVGNRLEVGWNRDLANIQIATLDGGDYDEAEVRRPGFYVHLDRAGINRLIRTLRKARDASFGADA